MYHVKVPITKKLPINSSLTIWVALFIGIILILSWSMTNSCNNYLNIYDANLFSGCKPNNYLSPNLVLLTGAIPNKFIFSGVNNYEGKPISEYNLKITNDSAITISIAGSNSLMSIIQFDVNLINDNNDIYMNTTDLLLGASNYSKQIANELYNKISTFFVDINTFNGTIGILSCEILLQAGAISAINNLTTYCLIVNSPNSGALVYSDNKNEILGFFKYYSDIVGKMEIITTYNCIGCTLKQLDSTSILNILTHLFSLSSLLFGLLKICGNQFSTNNKQQGS